MLAGLLFTAALDAAEAVVDVPTPRVQRLLAAMSREDKMAVIRAGRTAYVGASSHDLPLTAPITD